MRISSAIDETHLKNSGLTHGLIDCDIHPHVPSLDVLSPYMEEAWQKRIGIGKFAGNAMKDSNIPAVKFNVPITRYQHSFGAMRKDADPPNGGPPASDPEYLAQHWLDPFNISHAILLGGNAFGLSAYHDADLASAFASAYNDWLYNDWYQKDNRYKLAMVIAPQDPQLAVKEIERIGRKPGVVGIMINNMNIPLGNRHFNPIFEIAQDYDLPLFVHPGAEAAGLYAPSQSVGPASYYIEWHATLSLVGQRQIMSMVYEGIFERFPKLHFVFAEYGFAWMPHIMWRLDKNWKALRDEVPWVKKLPSEYIREHVSLTTQPLEESNRPDDILKIIEMIQAEDMLLFSSDYPHWDNDNPERVFKTFPSKLKNKIFHENARKLFKL
jgi:predicted TIM-barrel fold metal-dependent hydrolase